MPQNFSLAIKISLRLKEKKKKGLVYDALKTVVRFRQCPNGGLLKLCLNSIILFLANPQKLL